MQETFRNAMYLERRRILMEGGLSENDAHNTIKAIMRTEETQYIKDESLRNKMDALEQEGGVLDIYNNINGSERVNSLVTAGLRLEQAIELSDKMKEAETALIEQYNNEGRFKEQRDAAVDKTAEALQQLKEYTPSKNDVEDRVEDITYDVMRLNPANFPMTKPMARISACNQYVVGDILAIPASKDHPAVDAIQTFGYCRDGLIATGMPAIIADTRIVDAAIRMERNLAVVDDFTEGVESIPESNDTKYEI